MAIKDPRFVPKTVEDERKANPIVGKEIRNDTILTNHIANQSITAEKIANGAIGTSQINTAAEPTINTIYSNFWFRSNGATGWYSQDYGGGIHMTDTTWIRTYGSKNLYCNQEIRADVRLRAGSGENRIEPAAWDKIILCANGSTTAGGYFFYNSNNAYGVISDRRTKNTIIPLSEYDAVTFIRELKPVTFKMNGIDRVSCGFIAQDVLKAAKNDAQKNITPNHETYDETNLNCPLLGVSDHSMTPNIVSTIQYLMKIIDSQQKNIESLESRLKTIEDLLK
jgi:hypothetical protein